MKLYFMKQSALDYIKVNIGTLYNNYYRFDSPEWIDELFDYDPFEVFAEVPDFELCDLSLQPGEIVMQNAKILYTKLKDISNSQASDERLWAGLCNKTFYSYMRKRRQLAKTHLKKSVDDSSSILSAFFYKSSGRSGIFRNELARCWWTGRLTYTEKYPNHWELLDAIGAEDIVSKISEIFYSYTYSANPEIVEGICEGLKFFRDRDIHISSRDHLRPTVQYLNAVGGSVLLDMFTADEIKKLTVERLGSLIKGVDLGLIYDADDSDDLIDEALQNSNDNAEEVNIDIADYVDKLQPATEIDLNTVLGRLEKVEYGCKIQILKMPENTILISEIPFSGESLLPMQKWFLNKPIGSTFEAHGSTYEIVDIQR